MAVVQGTLQLIREKEFQSALLTQRRVANLIRDVQHARRTARRLSQENQTFVSRLRQILDPKETYNACTNMLHVAKRVRNCLDNKTSDTEKTIARLLESTVDPLDHEVVQKNLERARENLKAVRETIRRLEAKVKAQDQEKKQRRHAAAGLDASTQTDKPERKGNAHRASLEEAKSRISQLQANLSKQEADAAQLVAKSADEISRLRDEQAATEGKLSQSQANLDEISKQYHASEQAKEEAKAVLAALKSELDDAHASLDAQSGQASAQDGTISHLTASIKTLEEALARLETNNAVKEQLKKDLEVTITTLQKSLEGTVSRADAEKQCKEEVDRRLKIVLPALKKAAESNMEKLLKVKESSLEGQFKLKVQSQVLVRVAECLPHELKKQLDISGSLVRQAFDNAVRAQVEQGKVALESNYQDALNSRLQFQHEQYQSEVNVTAAAHGNELEGLRQTLADLQNRLQFVENDADTARSEADAQRTLAEGYAGTLNALSGKNANFSAQKPADNASSAALEDVPSATSTINQGDGGIPSETQNQDEAPIHPFEFSIDVGELSNLPIFDFNTGEFLPGTQLQDAVPAAPLDVGPDAGELTHTRIFNLEAGGVPSGAQNRDQVPDAPFNVNLDFGAVAAFNEPSSAALPALSIPESTSAFTEPLSNFHEDWQVDDATWDSIYGGDEGSLDEPTNFIVNSEQMNRLERLARRREKAPATAQEAENSGSLERDGREPELHDAQDPNSAEEDCAYDTDDQAAWAEAFEKAGFMDAVADTARNDEESTVPLPGQFIANHNRPMRRPRARARRPVGTPAATTGNIAGAVPASDGNEVIGERLIP